MQLQCSPNVDERAGKLDVVFQASADGSREKENHSISRAIFNEKSWWHSATETSDGAGAVDLAGRGTHHSGPAFGIDEFSGERAFAQR